MHTISEVLNRCKRTVIFSFTLLTGANTIAQDTVRTSMPSIVNEYPFSRKKTTIVAVTNIAAYGVILAGLYSTWYKDYPQSGFHTFNDGAEWLQVDKMGHAYSAYAESRISMEMWRWTGISRKKRIWLGGLSGAAYQTIIEVLDGFSSQWGWSWGDFGANIFGSGLLVSQELAWDQQRIQMKWSFHRKKYADEMLNQRSNNLYGSGTLERMLKDYNGQTYWISSGIQQWFPKSHIPKWLQISVGSGAEGLFGARENKSTDSYGNIIFTRTDIPRIRQWYLAPDIDFTKIRTRKKGVRLALNVLSLIKFPAPALEYSNGKLVFHYIYF